MKLKYIEVNEYKSIRDSNQVEIGDVTCFVGKNESGKTTLLEAIYRLNPIVESDGSFDVTDDYPRADVEDYQQAIEQETREHATVITATYVIDDEIAGEIESEFGKGVLKSRDFTLSKGYEGGRNVGLEVDQAKAVNHLLKTFELPADVSKEAAKNKSITLLRQFLAKHSQDCAQEQQEATEAANQLTDESAKAKALSSAKQLAESSASIGLREKLDQIRENKGLSLHIWFEYVKPHLPKFLYFDEYYQMEGQVNIEKLKERQSQDNLRNSDRPMLGLIELARLNLDQLLTPDRTEALVNKLEGASNHLSKQVLKYWSQNKHLQVKFDVRPAQSGDPEGMREGTNLWGRVHDSVHYVSTRLGTRSKGFVWFFSFLAWFSQQQKANEDLILLLDEPGLFLHAKAQGDLLRYIEQELKPHHQVLYTTHSPFMVDPHHFDRVRIVEDKSMDADDELPDEEKGTKVITEVLEASADSLFPIQGALGYDIAQTLFVGPNSLIVEGVSDLLYIQAMTEVLESKGREGLNSDWTITPVGGSDKVPTFCSLIGSQDKMNLATLIDFQKKDAQRIENLYKQKILQKKNVLTYADFCGNAEADVEDMFDVDLYLTLVNAEYTKEIDVAPTKAKLKSKNPRIVVRLETFFESNPLKKGKYNHYRPARHFLENTKKYTKSIDKDTLDRFENAFKALNALL